MDAAHLDKGQALIVMSPGDDVATALRGLAPGERVAYHAGGSEAALQILEPIPFGHKVALRDLPSGAEVHKYGSVIGRTTAEVRCGAHVHVHNLAGVRGRGDLAAGHGREEKAHAAQG